jgi:hypothetical protein
VASDKPIADSETGFRDAPPLISADWRSVAKLTLCETNGQGGTSHKESDANSSCYLLLEGLEVGEGVEAHGVKVRGVHDLLVADGLVEADGGNIASEDVELHGDHTGLVCAAFGFDDELVGDAVAVMIGVDVKRCDVSAVKRAAASGVDYDETLDFSGDFGDEDDRLGVRGVAAHGAQVKAEGCFEAQEIERVHGVDIGGRAVAQSYF